MRLGALPCAFALALPVMPGCALVAPPESCDLEVTVEEREFDVECDYDDDEGEYSCECTGPQGPVSQDPPSCEVQCASSCDCPVGDAVCEEDCTFCLEDCEFGREDDDGGFSEDFEDDVFCTLNDEDQESAAIAACGLE